MTNYDRLGSDRTRYAIRGNERRGENMRRSQVNTVI